MSAPYDLPLVQGERFQRTFQWTDAGGVAQDLTGRSFKSQIRQKESVESLLLLDLTPFITIAADKLSLLLDVPGSATMGVEAKLFKDTASWDIYLWPAGAPDQAFCFLQGAVTLDPATTDLKGIS